MVSTWGTPCVATLWHTASENRRLENGSMFGDSSWTRTSPPCDRRRTAAGTNFQERLASKIDGRLSHENSGLPEDVLQTLAGVLQGGLQLES